MTSPAATILIVSDRNELELIVNAINCGAINRFYSKPWDDNVLRDTIREAFRPAYAFNETRTGHGGGAISEASSVVRLTDRTSRLARSRSSFDSKEVPASR